MLPGIYCHGPKWPQNGTENDALTSKQESRIKPLFEEEAAKRRVA